MNYKPYLLLVFCSTIIAITSQASGQIIEDHVAANPVFRDLIEAPENSTNGLDYGIKLKAPAVPDGLTQEEQLAQIDQFLPQTFTREFFLQGKLSDLPVISRQFQKPKGEKDYGVSIVDVYFVAPGNLELLAKRDFLESLLDTSDEETAEGEVTELTDQQLADANIEPSSVDATREALRIVNAKLMDTIVLKGVSRTYWTQSKESIVLAIALDRRFDKKDNLQARWEKLIQQSDGSYEVDQTGSSYCIGVYLKITPLAGQKDQVLIEGHGVIVQPKVWFRGRDSIGDKLPTAIKQRVPEIRRKIQKELKG